MSEEDVRGEMLSRFDSSTVRMLSKETLIVTGPDGKDEYFVKKRQMGIKGKQRVQASSKQSTRSG